MKYKKYACTTFMVICVWALGFCEDGPTNRLDFDDGRKLGTLFRANGGVSLSGAAGPTDKSGSGAAGRALKVATKGNFVFYTIGQVIKFNSQTADTIRFQVFNPEGKKQRVDFIAIEADKKAIFWRKVEFDHQGWQSISLPMEWFRWNAGRGPLWENVNSIGIRGGAGLNFWIDGIEVVDAETDKGPYNDVDSLARVVFPSSDSVRHQTKNGIRVITNYDELDIDTLHSHLLEVKKEMLEWLPMWHDRQLHRPPTMVVSKDRDQYRGLFAHLGKQYVATLRPPTSQGYHVQGIGYSYYSKKFGVKRPVFTHEFAHSVASSIGRIDFSGRGWFQEGLASLVQIKFHPQKGIGLIMMANLKNPNNHDPLDKLTTGKAIGSNRYWQAMTLVDFLMNAPEMKDKFPNLIEAFDKTGKTNLALHLTPVYGMSFEELENKWSTYVSKNLARYDPNINPEA